MLDPEQNHTFVDHYLDLDFDLSKVMFICTANTMGGIPLPLQDRMEVIRLAGYTDLEKRSIAKRYLVPKQQEANGLADDHGHLPRLGAALRHRPLHEGVRGALAGARARQHLPQAGQGPAQEGAAGAARGTWSPRRWCRSCSGPPRFRHGVAEAEDQIGLTTGLAWTELGGELLTVEATVMPGKGKLTITGKLGDVMQESAQAAMSYVRSRAELLGLEKRFLESIDIHVHVPEGAIPKDGPSAGVTMATTLVSALCKIPVRRDVAMTGEITLRGRVLPIGGLKEKVLAAHRGGITRVLLPAREREGHPRDPAAGAREDGARAGRHGRRRAPPRAAAGAPRGVPRGRCRPVPPCRTSRRGPASPHPSASAPARWRRRGRRRPRRGRSTGARRARSAAA